jgi:hypothetical protein
VVFRLAESRLLDRSRKLADALTGEGDEIEFTMRRLPTAD